METDFSAKFLGQNCFLFTYKGVNILTDPFFEIGQEKSGFNLIDQEIHYVLITHAHGDHTADVEKTLSKYPNAKLIAQPEICAYFKHEHIVDINFGGSAKIQDLKISMVPASHTSSFPDGTYGGVPCGYIFRMPGKNVYFAGDTGVMADMGLFPELFGPIDVAVLPIGSHYTMCARKASFAATALLKTPRVIGCHFDTFPPIEIDHQSAKELFDERNIDLTLPKLGEQINF